MSIAAFLPSNISTNTSKKQSSKIATSKQSNALNIKKNKLVINCIRRQTQNQQKTHRQLQDSFAQVTSISFIKSIMALTTPRKALSSLNGKNIKVSKVPKSQPSKSYLSKNTKKQGNA